MSITSAFTSAGQRCSALRVLYLQEEIAERVIAMLIGAMRCLAIGAAGRDRHRRRPGDHRRGRAARLAQHAARMRSEAKLLYACELDARRTAHGHFFPPQLVRAAPPRSAAGPRSSVRSCTWRAIAAASCRRCWRRSAAPAIGLTLGVHSRLESVAQHVFRSLPVGNTYVNRNMIGAVVGVQPFGGQGLSGTGPKAGGPHYLLRFANERTLTVNTAAIGGNVELLA